jgi:hypothetical protein
MIRILPYPGKVSPPSTTSFKKTTQQGRAFAFPHTTNHFRLVMTG